MTDSDTLPPMFLDPAAYREALVRMKAAEARAEAVERERLTTVAYYDGIDMRLARAEAECDGLRRNLAELAGYSRYGHTQAPPEEAHRIAREEAQPYITEALERIAKWLETDGLQDAVGNSVAGLFHAAAHEVREMATGARPLPGGKP